MCVVSDPWKLHLVVSSVVGGSLPGVFQTSVAKSPHSRTTSAFSEFHNLLAVTNEIRFPQISTKM